jgi:hypothetical protein
MFGNNTALKTIREGGYGSADFDIDTEKLSYYPRKYRDGEIFIQDKQISSKTVVYRTDTGAELGVHGHDYKPVPPKYMIDLTRNILERSDLCLDNLVERIDTSHDGVLGLSFSIGYRNILMKLLVVIQLRLDCYLYHLLMEHGPL